MELNEITGLFGFEVGEETTIEQVKEAFQGYTEKVKEASKNDPEWLKAETDKINARVYKSSNNKIKREFGVTDEQIKAIREANDGKVPTDELLKVGKQNITSNSKSTTEDIQNQLIKANKRFEEYKEKDVPAMLAKKDMEIADMSMGLQKTKVMTEDHGKLVQVYQDSPDVLLSFLSTREKGLYDIRIEKGIPVPYLKGTDAQATNEAGTDVLSYEDTIREGIEQANGYRKSNGNSATVIDEGGKIVSNGEVPDWKKRMLERIDKS